MKESSVYIYFLPELKAVKVGYGGNARARMLSYAKQYHLNVDVKTLKEWRIPSNGLAANIESECHHTLVELGFERVVLEGTGSEANEIFALKQRKYEEAVELVAAQIDEVFAELRGALPEYSHAEKAKAAAVKAKVKQKQAADRAAQVSAVAETLRRDFETYYSDWKKCQLAAERHNEVHGRKPVKKRNMFGIARTEYVDGEDWLNCPTCVQNTEKIFFATRKAKQLWASLYSKYEYNVIEEGEKAAGEFLYNVRVGGKYSYQPPIVYDDASARKYWYGGDMAVHELVKCVYLAHGQGGGAEKALEFLKRHASLQRLVVWARQNKPPEV